MRTVRTLLYIAFYYFLPIGILIKLTFLDIDIWWRVVLLVFMIGLFIIMNIRIEMLLGALIVRRYIRKAVGIDLSKAGSEHLKEFTLGFKCLLKFGFFNLAGLCADQLVTFWVKGFEYYDPQTLSFYEKLFSLPKERLDDLLKKELFEKVDVQDLIIESGLK